jgi:hypothetical protein
VVVVQEEEKEDVGGQMKTRPAAMGLLPWKSNLVRDFFGFGVPSQHPHRLFFSSVRCDK